MIILSNNKDIYLIFLDISLIILDFLIIIYFIEKYMADIFDEVSEELKHDQLIKTWKKYSKLIISFITIIIISIISYQAYKSWNEKEIETISAQHFNALEKLENESFSESMELFLKNSKQKNGYKILSLFGLVSQIINKAILMK